MPALLHRRHPGPALPWGAAVWLWVGLVGCGGGSTDCPTRYADRDGDGYGDRNAVVGQCDAPGVFDGTDCDDRDADTFPGAPELCNNRDDDCNGLVDDADDGDRTAPGLWYVDVDGDGVGSGRPWSGCGQPPPLYTATTDGDCDDNDPAVFPGAVERCNGRDDDCDGTTDIDAVDAPEWFLDTDGDGYGIFFFDAVACDADDIESGTYAGYGDYYHERYEYYGLDGVWVTQSGDCDDRDPTRYPGAPELCDAEDNDCDGQVDEGATVLNIGWIDRDGDGWGGDEPIEVCGLERFHGDPDGRGVVYVTAVAGDCDDDDEDVRPDSREVCNGQDDDCDGLVDDADPSRSTLFVAPWHLDVDGDGFGDPATATYTCSPPAPPAVTDRSDCDDGDDAVRPDAPEVCNLRDDDCDGHIDDFDSDLVGGPCP